MRNRHLLHIASILSLCLLFLLGVKCKPKKQEIPPFGDVHLDVVDENKKPIDSATIYLYNSQAAFDLAAQNAQNGIYNSTGSIATGKIVKGKIVFSDLPSNTEYWVLAHDVAGFFMDGTLKTNFEIDRDNADAYFFVPSFQNGTTVTATIRLVPAYSLIKFQTTNSDLLTKVKIRNEDLKDDLLSGNYAKVRKGNAPFYVRTNSCVWSGEVQAEAGKVVTANLGNCAYSAHTFQTVAGNFSGPNDFIKIYIGQNRYDATQPPIAILSANELNKLVVLANDGTGYTYYAVHSNGKCIWEGQVGTVVTLNSCY